MVQDIYSFVGFILFYAAYVPNAELAMSKLRELMKLPYEDSMVLLAIAKQYAEQNNMLQALLADSYIAHFDPTLRYYLCTDFLAIDFGYALF